MVNISLLKLTERFKEGEIEAFSLIYNGFKDLIRYYSLKIGDEDSFQELTVFLLELLYKIDLSGFKSDYSDNFQRYISVCLRNKYIEISKKHQKNRDTVSETYENYLGSIDSDYERLYIKELIEKLPLKQARVIVYRYIYGYSDAEISKLFGISRQSVFYLRMRGLENLRRFYF